MWEQLTLPLDFGKIEVTTTEKENTMKDKPVIEEVPYEEMHLVDLLDEEEEE